MRLVAAAMASFLLLAGVPAAAAPLARVDGDGFTMMMPGAPREASQKIEIPGGTVATRTWTVSPEDMAIYSMSTADYPEAVAASRPAADFVTEARDGLINQLKGRVTAEKPITIGGNAGLEFSVTFGSGEVRARSVMVGRRLYTMLVLSTPSIGARHAEGFLSSLRLTR